MECPMLDDYRFGSQPRRGVMHDRAVPNENAIKKYGSVIYTGTGTRQYRVVMNDCTSRFGSIAILRNLGILNAVLLGCTTT